MSRTIDKFSSHLALHRFPRQSLLAISLIGAFGTVAAQSTIPDAQVEANVLKALAGAPELANESITTRTVYGTVTLSGSVSGEAARTKAENLAANAKGVQKVVDELRLASENAQNPAPQPTPSADNAAPLLLQSDGTYAPAGTQNPAPGTAPAETAQRNNPEADQALDQQPASQASMPAQPNTAAAQPVYPPQPNGRRPVYPTYPGYTPYGYPQQGAQQPYPQQPPAGNYAQQPYPQQPPMGGQVAGQPVTIPSGALLRVRVNHTLNSNHSQPGTIFDGTVVNDVIANGLVAIPRGASVQGKVVDSKSSGALGGRGQLSIQLTQVTLGGKSYPVASDVWAHNGNDKTIETVNKTLGVGALGAVIGAIAGGGKGAAIGGGVGAAAGLGSSAASGNGEVFIPAEAIVTFHTVADTQVATVSEQEMQRLAYGAGPGAEQPPLRRVYRVYPGYPSPYPGYYPYPYPPAGYPPY
jgi:hypothetical protein